MPLVLVVLAGERIVTFPSMQLGASTHTPVPRQHPRHWSGDKRAGVAHTGRLRGNVTAG